MVAGFSNGTGVFVATGRSQALCSIKSDFLKLSHQADVVVNGKSIEQWQPFINIARHFQLISEMSVNDLAARGHSIGGPTLDNPKVAKCSTTFANTESVEMRLNQYKVGRYVDITNTTGCGVYGDAVLMTSAQLNAEFRVIIYYDCGVYGDTV